MSGANSKVQTLLTSTIALKIWMALTGVILTAFLVEHMIGHLQVFAGRDAYNSYAEFLQGLGPIKWIARLSLLGAIAVHIACAVTLKLRNQNARPMGYAGGLKRDRGSLAATIMFEGGLVVLAFIIYHIAHFTLGVVHVEGFDLVDGDRRDVYSHFVMSFQNPVIVGVYVVANLALAAHLAHGVQSMFKSLGLAVKKFRGAFELIGPALASIVFLGFVAVPLACLLGLVKL